MLAGTHGVRTIASGAPARVSIKTLGDAIAGPSRNIVLAAWAMCALILVLCSANLGGILLTRCTYQLREYALRSALGAPLSNLVRTLLLELFGIAFIAALVAAYIARSAMPYIADRVPLKSAAFGMPVFGLHAVFFLIAAAMAVMFASAAPAIAVLARNYYKGFSQGILAVFRRHRALRILLTTAQTAIATLLLCLCWITVRGYTDIFFRDTGVNTDTRVITVLYPPMGRIMFEVDVYGTLNVLRGGNPNRRVAAFKGINFFREGRTLSGALALEKRLIENSRPGEYYENELFRIFSVSSGFFQTLDVKIIAGRDFNDTDMQGREVIVNEALVRKMGWTPWEAVGRQTSCPQSGNNNRNCSIVGVVKDFLTSSWDSDIIPEFYTPINRDEKLLFQGMYGTTVHYIIHQDELRHTGNIEKTVRSFDPDASITRNSTWGEALGATVRGRSFATFCITLFTIAAIAIVITGIAGTVTFIVARRTRDIAIQIAMGAPRGRVCWFVMKEMVIAGVIGALIGGIAGWWAGKIVAHYVYNGEKYQNLTGLAIATVFMLAVIAAASLLPALRALRIEPARMLNME
jgi:hypothetical protein